MVGQCQDLFIAWPVHTGHKCQCLCQSLFIKPSTCVMTCIKHIESNKSTTLQYLTWEVLKNYIFQRVLESLSLTWAKTSVCKCLIPMTMFGNLNNTLCSLVVKTNTYNM